MRIYHCKMATISFKLIISFCVFVIIVYGFYKFYHVSSIALKDQGTSGDVSSTLQAGYSKKTTTSIEINLSKESAYNITDRRNTFHVTKKKTGIKATKRVKVPDKSLITRGSSALSSLFVDKELFSRARAFLSSYKEKSFPRRLDNLRRKQILRERPPKRGDIRNTLSMSQSNTRKRFPSEMDDGKSARDLVNHFKVPLKHGLSKTHSAATYLLKLAQFSKKSPSFTKWPKNQLKKFESYQKGHILGQHKSLYPNDRMLSSLLHDIMLEYREGFLNDSTFYREVIPVNMEPKQSVLLLHATNFTSTVWVNIGTLEVLGASGYRSVAIDLPGYGRSHNATIPYSSDEIIVYMIEVFQAFGFIKPVNVAPSKSGEYLMPLLMEHPTLVSGIVAISPTHTSDYSRRSYEQLTVPALVLLGKEDGSMLNWASLDNLEHLKNRKIFAIANATSQCYAQQPATFHKLVLTFLDNQYVHGPSV